VGFDQVVTDETFRRLVFARVVEPTSKRDTLRVLGRLGYPGPSYRTVQNCLDRSQDRGYRTKLEQTCAQFVNVSRLTFCLYDVTTLHWETDTADEFRIPGFSKERHLEPQITVGLLTDPGGFPLTIQAFEGNKAETLTIVPVLDRFRAHHPGVGITVVADAGMMSEKNLKALEKAGYQFIVGGRIPIEPIPVRVWRLQHPGEDLADQQIFHQIRSGAKKDPHRWDEWFQYRVERARSNQHGIEESIRKARKIMAGQATSKKNRFLKDSGGTLELDQELIDSATRRAGLRSYVTNTDADPQYVIDTYHQLWHIEKSFRISKHDLAARPAYHWKRERIEAHLTIVFAALALSRWIENVTGISLKAFLNAVEPIRQVTLDINGHPATGEDPITGTALHAITAIMKAGPH
jgi:transposase